MRLSRPLSSYVRITQRFNPSRHFGLDLSAYTGTPVYATVNGIAYGRVETRGFGRYVRIETPEAKVYSAHLDRYTVGDGQVVKRGQIIGYSGSTGNSTGPHLHLEVRRNAGSPFRHNAIDPWPLIDWDPASNALNWQWVAGSGPDAAPYFRVFNPAGQAEKFDAQGRYRRRWLAEMSRTPGEAALDFYEAAPRSWGLNPGAPYPQPLISLEAGRARALDAYAKRNA